MSYWILPSPLDDLSSAMARRQNELLLHSDGLASLARAQGEDQIGEWLRALMPEATPERIATLSQHYWRLGHELVEEDTIIARVQGGDHYIIGEVTGNYRRETRDGTAWHVWPVEWNPAVIPAGSIPLLAPYAYYESITEITNDKILELLKPYIPKLRKGNATFFRWLGIAILITELIYFWPRGD